jgi:hypothetical protein
MSKPVIILSSPPIDFIQTALPHKHRQPPPTFSPLPQQVHCAQHALACSVPDGRAGMHSTQARIPEQQAVGQVGQAARQRLRGPVRRLCALSVSHRPRYL